MAARRFSDVDDQVGRRLRERRKALGTTQRTLGEVVGVSYQQVQKYENGSCRVSAVRLSEMARHLGVTLDYFFDAVGSPPGNQATPELVRNNDKQVIGLVKNFSQISSARERSAVAHIVRVMAREAEAKPRMKHRLKE